jgi:hypothetical protein
MASTPNFSLAHCKSLSFQKSIEYIGDYFIPLDDGTHAFLSDNKWTIKTDDIVKRVYFNRLSPLLSQYYFTEYDRVLTPIYDKSKPLFYLDYINFDYVEIKHKLHEMFLIDEYINKKLDMSIKPKDLYEQYAKYCGDKDGILNKTNFTNSLNDLGIKAMKCGTNVYKFSFNELFEIGLNNKFYYLDKKDVEINCLKKEVDELKIKLTELSSIKVDEPECDDVYDILPDSADLNDDEWRCRIDYNGDDDIEYEDVDIDLEGDDLVAKL